LDRLREDREITHTYHSNAIEGSTMTLRDTGAILLDGITIAGKPLRKHLEVTNLTAYPALLRAHWAVGDPAGGQ
jgi:Fic family protein